MATVRMTAVFTKLDPIGGRSAIYVEHPFLGLRLVRDQWLIDSWTWEQDELVDIS
jgi:hypothetical protein